MLILYFLVKLNFLHVIGCLYGTLNYQPYLTMTKYNGLRMVGKCAYSSLDGLENVCL